MDFAVTILLQEFSRTNFVPYELTKPDQLFILTDGYAPFPNETLTMGIPVLWIINNMEVTPPWGKVARIS